MLNIVSAGNEGVDIDMDSRYWYPSEVKRANLITVAATNHDDNLATFSCYGTASVDIAPPGELIRVINRYGSWGYGSGTSMATPFVAGVAGLLLAEVPSLTNNPADAKDRILENADQVNSLKNRVMDKKRLNAFNTIK